MYAFGSLFCNRSTKSGRRMHPLHISLLVLACLGFMLGGPSVCHAADMIQIGGDVYDEPGASGAGWEWRDASTLVLSGYNGANISVEGDVTLLLEGENSATFAVRSDVLAFADGVECWGNLTIRGNGNLTAQGGQAGIIVMGGTLAIEGADCKVAARATGDELEEGTCAGVLVDALRVAEGSVLTASSAVDTGKGSFGVCVGMLHTAGTAARAVVDTATVDATGATGGFVCAGEIALTGTEVVLPQGGAVGSVTVAGADNARGVVDSAGAMALHAVILPVGTGDAGGGAGEGGSGGAAGGGATGGESGGTVDGGGTGGAAGPANPGGGSATGATGGTGADGASKQPAGKTPAAAPVGDNGSEAKAAAAPAAMGTGARSATSPLPTLGEVPAHIALLALASLAFFGFAHAVAKGQGSDGSPAQD